MDSYVFTIFALVLMIAFIRIKRRLTAVDVIINKLRKSRHHLRLGDMAELDARTNGRIKLTNLENLTAQLKQLGFCFLGDIFDDVTYDQIPFRKNLPIVDPHQELEPPSTKVTQTTGISRVFGHPVHGCYALLASAVTITHSDSASGLQENIAISPFRVSIQSKTKSADAPWFFINDTRDDSPLLSLFRHPRRLGHRMSAATPEQLLQTHLVERDDIAKRGNFEWEMEPSIEKHRTHEAETLRHLYEVNRKISTLRFTLYLFTYKFKNHDWWLGDLEKQEK